jgi:hypothetical protein
LACFQIASFDPLPLLSISTVIGSLLVRPQLPFSKVKPNDFVRAVGLRESKRKSYLYLFSEILHIHSTLAKVVSERRRMKERRNRVKSRIDDKGKESHLLEVKASFLPLTFDVCLLESIDFRFLFRIRKSKPKLTSH